jgi:hypothetical protein
MDRIHRGGFSSWPGESSLGTAFGLPWASCKRRLIAASRRNPRRALAFALFAPCFIASSPVQFDSRSNILAIRFEISRAPACEAFKEA